MADPNNSHSSDSEGSTDVEELLQESRRVIREGTGPVEAKKQTVEISDLHASMNDDGDGDGDGLNHDEPPAAAAVPRKHPPTASRRARIAGIRVNQPTTNKRVGGSKNSTKISTTTAAAAAPAPVALATLKT